MKQVLKAVFRVLGLIALFASIAVCCGQANEQKKKGDFYRNEYNKAILD